MSHNGKTDATSTLKVASIIMIKHDIYPREQKRIKYSMYVNSRAYLRPRTKLHKNRDEKMFFNFSLIFEFGIFHPQIPYIHVFISMFYVEDSTFCSEMNKKHGIKVVFVGSLYQNDVLSCKIPKIGIFHSRLL